MAKEDEAAGWGREDARFGRARRPYLLYPDDNQVEARDAYVEAYNDEAANIERVGNQNPRGKS